MDCSEFLSLFSDYYDGSGDEELRRRMEAHEAECRSCRHYGEVVERGVNLLRELPKPRVPPDFRPRLRHRIYHEADDEVLSRRSVASGVRGTLALGIAVLFAVAAWSPTLRTAEPEVDLPPIVVSEGPAQSPGLQISPARFFGPGMTGLRGLRGDGPWIDRQHPFQRRSGLDPLYVRTTLLRTGLD